MRLGMQHSPARAFSLLEVMIAMALFFMAIFAILDLTSRNLRAARSLEPLHIDASSIASEIALTNRLVEGVESGDFGDLYPGYAWTRTITEASSNGLFKVDFTIVGGSGNKNIEYQTSILLYRPLSPPAALNRGVRRP